MNNRGDYQSYSYNLGGGYGPAGTPPPIPTNNSYAGHATLRDNYNVRDCMYWPASVQTSASASKQAPNSYPAGCQRGGNYSDPSSTHPCFTGGEQVYAQPAPDVTTGFSIRDPFVYKTGYGAQGQWAGTGEPGEQQQVPPTPIKAYVSTPTEAGGVGGNVVPIPCHIGGPGQIPSVPPPAPIGYRITVPPLEPTPPLDFEIKQ